MVLVGLPTGQISRWELGTDHPTKDQEADKKSHDGQPLSSWGLQHTRHLLKI